MRTDTVQSIKANWIKISFVFVGLIIISLTAYSIHLYQLIDQSETVDYEVTENRVNQELALSSIEEISRYHGTTYFHVVEALSTEEKELIIFVNQADQSEELIIFTKEELVSDTEIVDKWKEETEYEKIHQIQYGIRNEIPLIEIIYIDQNQRLSYDYYRLDNGEYDSGISFAHK